MPLQIRRGTDAQRTAITPLTGELIYTTDGKRLYIGDGTTLGGVQLTGYTNEDAVDAVAAALLAGTSQNISFTYGTTQDSANRIDATVNISSLLGNLNVNGYTIYGTGNINLQGTIESDFVGSVSADNSTLLVDATNGSIVLEGTVKGNIVSDFDSAYDIGSAAYKFRDLYIDSVHVGNAIMTSIGSGINLPAGSTIDGAPLGAPGTGGSLNIDIVGDDSTVLVNSATNTLGGTFVGDMNGSVYSDNSTIMVDAVDLRLSNGTLELSMDKIYSANGNLNFGSENEPVTNVRGYSRGIVQVSVNATGTITGAGVFDNKVSRGTLTAPTAMQAGDYLGGYLMSSYDGADYNTTSLLVGQVDTVTGTEPFPGKMLLGVKGHNGGFVGATVNSRGVLESTAFRATPFADATARDTALPTGSVLAGMVCFLTSTSKLQVNTNGTTGGWVDLH